MSKQASKHRAQVKSGIDTRRQLLVGVLKAVSYGMPLNHAASLVQEEDTALLNSVFWQ
jgi:hypothetical protein